MRQKSGSFGRGMKKADRDESAQSAIGESFATLWEELFTTPVHLDSALAKRTPAKKSVLAQLVPPILLRPCSLADSYGVGLRPGEPWSIPPQERAGWRTARFLAEAIHQRLDRQRPPQKPLVDDFPPEMIAAWEKDFGREVAHRLAQALGVEAPLGLRVRRSRGVPAVLEELTRGSRLPVRAEASPLSPVGIRLAGYAPVLSTEAFERGDFEIQDEGSQLMALFALDPLAVLPSLGDQPGGDQPGEGMPLPPRERPKLPEIGRALTVVDACAGAGGKSLAFSDLLGGKGRIYAYDVSARKLEALRRRAKRAGFSNIQTVAVKEGEEAETVRPFRHRADVVLVDAPCSGWGVLRRNPDIKWRQEPGALERLPALQARILGEYSELVAPGGRLVFGVCTFRKAETTEIVHAFSQSHPDFEPVGGGYLGPGPTDGFFMHAWKRREKV
jgi:16S rRNA C967 or C1407 C5-methylase (RsmB/RsmF family)